MPYVARFTTALFALILIAFAGLQLNDPDPFIWVGFYLICTAVPLLVALGKWIGPVFWLALLVCAIELALSAQGAYNYYLHMDQEPLMQSMNPEKPYIEEAREFLGAFIALALIVASAWLVRFTTKNN